MKSRKELFKDLKEAAHVIEKELPVLQDDVLRRPAQACGYEGVAVRRQMEQQAQSLQVQRSSTIRILFNSFVSFRMI